MRWREGLRRRCLMRWFPSVAVQGDSRQTACWLAANNRWRGRVPHHPPTMNEGPAVCTTPIGAARPGNGLDPMLSPKSARAASNTASLAERAGGRVRSASASTSAVARSATSSRRLRRQRATGDHPGRRANSGPRMSWRMSSSRRRLGTPAANSANERDSAPKPNPSRTRRYSLSTQQLGSTTWSHRMTTRSNPITPSCHARMDPRPDHNPTRAVVSRRGRTDSHKR